MTKGTIKKIERKAKKEASNLPKIRLRKSTERVLPPKPAEELTLMQKFHQGIRQEIANRMDGNVIAID